MNKASILKQRRLHRAKPEGFVLNFLLNYSAPARLMHSFLPPAQGEHEILHAAMRAYIIGIAACLETFFRDLYLFRLQSDSALIQEVLTENGLRESINNLPKYLANGLPAEEFAAAQVSFQSAVAIDKNFAIFFGESFFDALDQFELVCEVPASKQPGPARLKMLPGWRIDVDRVFSLRHEFAHDANSTTKVSIEEMRGIETTALLLCQMTGWFSELRSGRIYTSRDLPAVLLISDLIADDWELSDDRSAL